MIYTVHTTPKFDRDFKKLDHYTQKMILSWISKKLEGTENPRQYGKALLGNYAGQWWYRIGDCRLLCLIDDDKLIILSLAIGHRRYIYK